MRPSFINRIAIFCGSANGSDPAFRKVCINTAKILHSRRIGLVYGGGNIGLMGILADEMLRLGGEVTGVIPQKLVDIEVVHNGLTNLHIVPGMHERKALMTKLSDAFLILPGGIGTMDEFFEVFTWLQLGYHHKPIALLNTSGFYNNLIGLLESMVQRGFLKKDRYDQLIIGKEVTDLIDRITGSENRFP
ncbi:MAG: TIGR00730 family Rossman fold protein [Bacteroidales bacterium]|nr:TIGR00730 family Rossman fold protein [Bacteroidales bacterium]